MSCPRCAGLGPMLLAPFQGPPGLPSPAGEDAGFGQLRVADMHVDPEDHFVANSRQQLIFTADPAQTQNQLRAPFTGVTWTGNRIVARPDRTHPTSAASSLMAARIGGVASQFR